MKYLPILPLFLGILIFGTSPMSFAQTTLTAWNSCDELYSHRGPDLLTAATCYQALIEKESPENQNLLFERALVALSAVVNDSPKTDAEYTAFDQGLLLVDELSKKLGQTAEYYYWHAVFISFQAIAYDRGQILPRRTFGVIKLIQQELNEAIRLKPEMQFQGPSRVLGIMHTQMPGIVGGDKTLAESLLKTAYEAAPILSANHLAYAKILVVNGSTDLAKSVLNKFLALSDADLNPYPKDPLRSLLPETIRDREAAKKLLLDINSED